MSDSTVDVRDPELLSRIAHLRLAALRTVDSMLAGLHKSPHRGASMTFVEHRDYVPGDDTRLLDWRAFARNDRYVIRRFEQESQQSAYLMLDVSRSMAFSGVTGTRETTSRKIDYAATLLGAMAYVLLLQGDAVGAFCFDRAIRRSLPPRQRPQHFDAVIELLSDRYEGADAIPRTTSLRTALNELMEHAPRRRLIVLASDMIDFDEHALPTLASLRGVGHEVILFHVLSPTEISLPFDGAVHVEGLENEAPIDADVTALRRAYDDQLQAWLSRCQQTCRDAGIRYTRAITDMPPEDVLVPTLVNSRKRGWT